MLFFTGNKFHQKNSEKQRLLHNDIQVYDVAKRLKGTDKQVAFPFLAPVAKAGLCRSCRVLTMYQNGFTSAIWTPQPENAFPMTVIKSES